MVSVARILSTTEERHQSCLFRRGGYRNKRHNTENCLGFESDEVLCSSKTKHLRRMAPRQNFFISERTLQELRSQTWKLSWVRVTVKILGLGTTFSAIFNDIWPSGWHTTWHIRTHDESPDGRRCDADTRCHIYADEPSNATRHDADNPTLSVVTPTVATPTKYSIYV
jgi:hypothetical protein